MIKELERMLRRVRQRSLPESLLERAIADEIARQLNEPPFPALGSPAPDARPLPAAHLGAAMEDAQRALSQRRFAAAIAALRTAAELRRGAVRRAAAAAEHIAAVAERDRWIRDLALAQFGALPTLRIIDRLLALAGALLAAGEAQKAAIVTRMAQQTMLRLFRRQPGPAAGLPARLARLPPTGSGERPERIRALALAGYILLASRLDEDLAAEHACRQATAAPDRGRLWQERLRADLAATAERAGLLGGQLQRGLPVGGDS